MSSKGKGKEVATYGSKRKQISDDGKRAKRNRTGVLQFFEDAADVQSSDESEESDFDEDDFMEEELNLNIGTEKSQNIPFVPKDEVIEEEEFDRMMEERYKSGAGFVKYAYDAFEANGTTDKDSLMSSNKAPTLWKVKCGIGRERHSVFCLMQKFVDLQSLGNKLQIISAFSVDHVKGFIYIEAEKQCDIGEACKGLSSIYYSRVTVLPPNEISHLLSVRSTTCDISAGMWARVKNGKYKGDLAQVVAVNSARKRATVKLIPRIDLQALAGKFGGGAPLKKNAIAAPRLISSSELEEFRPLIQYRCDRDTGKRFEVLDGLMLKDGFLYKKVSIDSLSFWGIMPREEELLRFKNSESSESVDTEWLSQLYGDRKSKKISKNEKGGGKGESSSSTADDGFELYNLVCFGRKDFGLIVDKEKDDYYKILKEGSEGQVVVTIERRELKSGPLDARFSALDHQKKLISVNDTVKFLEGPLKDKQGLVKQIYRGTVFIHDENESENGGYFCCRSQMCEKIKLFADQLGKDEEPGRFEFGGFPASPKSPLVEEEKPWQSRESRNDSNREKDALFSIGQTLRIRVGPLKGYLCRVIAVRRADVTVKLDSQQKVLTVKNEHLCEVSRKNTMASSDNDTSSFKPFDLLGSEGCSGGWGDGARTSTETGGWNAGRLSTEGNSWPSLSSSGVKPEEESNSLSKSSWDAVPKKDDENNAWGQQSIQTSKSSWDTAPKKDDETNEWGQQLNHPIKSSWDTAPKKYVETVAWGKQSDHPNDENNVQQCNQMSKSSWDTALKKDDETNAWGKQSDHPIKSTWDSAPKKDDSNAWGKKSDHPSTSSWDTAPKKVDENNAWGESNHLSKSSLDTPNKDNETNAWGQQSNQPSKSSWDTAPKKDDENNAWGRKLPQADKPSWGSKAVEQDSKADTAKQDHDSAWGKKTSASQDSNWGNKAVYPNQESGWGAKGNLKSGSSNANQGSDWGGSSNWKSGSGETTKDSTWSSGGKWNSRDSSDDQTMAKKSDWSTGAGESDWGSKGSWKQNSTSASQDSGWGSKGGWQSGSGDANKNSTWSNNGKWSSGDGNEDQSKTFGNRGNGGNWRGSGSGDRGGFRGRGRSDRGGYRGRGRYDTEGFGGRGGDRGGFQGDKPSWGSKAVEQDSEAATAKQDQDSAWGKKTTASQDSSWGNKAVDTNQESGWGAKGNWKSGSSNANQGSGWGSSSNWQSGSGEATKDSTWSSGGKWNSRDSSDDQTGAKKNDWNTGAGESDWGSKGSWKQNSTSSSQDSGWGSKGGWQSGSGDANKISTWSNNGKWSSGDGNEDQSETFGSRGNGGNWRGRGSGDRGGFGGRGRNDNEGFGGRGGDRGGFRGRGERGRFGGGRGRGRSNDWNGNNGGDDGKAFSWGKETNDNQGWKRGDSSSGGSLKSWNSVSDGTKHGGGWNNQGSSGKDADSTAGCWKSASWNVSGSEKETTGGSVQVAGWNKVSSGGSDTGASVQAAGWNNVSSGGSDTGGWNKVSSGGSDTGGSVQAAGWNKASSGGSDTGGWNKVSSGGSDTGGWNNEGSGQKPSSGSGATIGGQSESWNQANAADGDQSSWEQKKDANADGKPSSWGNEAAGDGGRSSAWNQSKPNQEDTGASRAKPESSTWGKPSDGGQVSGWNQSKDAKEDANASWGKKADWGKGIGDSSSKGGW